MAPISAFVALELQALEVVHRLAQRGVFDLVDGLALEAGRRVGRLQHHVPGLAAQARAVAVGAGLCSLVAGQVPRTAAESVSAVAPLQVGQDAFERVVALDAAALAVGALAFVDEGNVHLTRAMQQHLAGLLGQLLPKAAQGRRRSAPRPTSIIE